MGAVYEAIDERFGEPIALKEVLLETGDTPIPGQLEALSNAFEREAKSLAKARHEAVPFVRDFFGEGMGQYLVMELVEGDDLAKQLARRGQPFPVEMGLEWMAQLLDALDYLHNLSPPIIHRDIKPQNLKLNNRGKIKLLDFGIAKSLDSGTFTITNQTFVGATLNYSPIEQLIRVMNPTFREYILLKHKDRAERILGQATDCRSDIYALGATFYHLLTGAPPSDVIKRTLDVWEKRNDPLPAPSTLNPEVPPTIDQCLMRALSIERDDRFGSAAEMRSLVFGETSGAAVLRTAPIGSAIPQLPELEAKDPAKARSGKTTEVLLKWDAQQQSGPSQAGHVPADPATTAASPGFTGQTGPFGSLDAGPQIGEAFGSIPHFSAVSETRGSDPGDGRHLDIAAGVIHENAARSNGANKAARPGRSYLFWTIPFGVMGILAIAMIAAIAFIGWSPGSAAMAVPDQPAANIADSEPSPPPAFEGVTTDLTSPTPELIEPSPTETPVSETPDQADTNMGADISVPVDPPVSSEPKERDKRRPVPDKRPPPPKPKPKDTGVGCMFNNTCK